MKKLICRGKRIQSIGVMLLCRDNEAYLPMFSRQMTEWEKAYDIKFHYFILENSSKDATSALIDHFLGTRCGYRLSPGNTEYFNSLERTRRIANYRNILFDSCRAAAVDWFVVLDTDTLFSADILQHLFSSADNNPKAGLICAYGIEVFGEQGKAGWLTQNHYYDTFAFVGEDRQLHWPNCIFAGCRKCEKFLFSKGTPGLEQTHDVRVLSAFGGAAIFPADVANHRDIRWEALATANGDFLCEHIGFTNSVRTHLQREIIISVKSKLYWDSGFRSQPKDFSSN